MEWESDTSPHFSSSLAMRDTRTNKMQISHLKIEFNNNQILFRVHTMERCSNVLEGSWVVIKRVKRTTFTKGKTTAEFLKLLTHFFFSLFVITWEDFRLFIAWHFAWRIIIAFSYPPECEGVLNWIKDKDAQGEERFFDNILHVCLDILPIYVRCAKLPLWFLIASVEDEEGDDDEAGMDLHLLAFDF